MKREPREIWKPIPGYPKHEASSLGRIRSLPMITKRGHKRPSRLLKFSGRFCCVNVFYGVRQGPVRVGVLVLRAFSGPPKPGQMCRHLDDEPWNNKPYNLTWGTRKQNSEDASKNGRLSNNGRYFRTKRYRKIMSRAMLASWKRRQQ